MFVPGIMTNVVFCRKFIVHDNKFVQY